MRTKKLPTGYSQKQHRNFAAQGRVAARSSANLTFILLVAAAASWGWGSPLSRFFAKGLLGAGVLMALATASELRSVKLNERAAISPRQIGRPLSEATDKEATWSAMVDGGPVVIKALRRDPIALEAADKTVAMCHSGELGRALSTFLREEAAKSPELAEEILDLKLDELSYPVRGDSRTAEVSFSEESGGTLWTCLLTGSDFRALSREG